MAATHAVLPAKPRVWLAGGSTPSGPRRCQLPLLIGLLTLLRSLGAATGSFRFGLFLRGVALGLGLVLLRLALADEVVATGHGPDRLLGLALDVFDDASDSFFGSAVLCHGF